MEKKNLQLNNQKKWFDMIKQGIKPEEYRDVKEWCISMFFDWKKSPWTRAEIVEKMQDPYFFEQQLYQYRKDYDTITFSNGMTPPVPRFDIEYLDIEFRTGNPEWGAEENKKYFVLVLGKIK